MKKRMSEIRRHIIPYVSVFCMGMLACSSLAVQAEEFGSDIAVEQEEPGTYTIAEGWILDEDTDEDEKKVYIQSAYVDAEETSTITCSYVDTNYSVLEYEQLRDMLTDNLFYNNMNAQISTSAVYTLEKDYLYILIVDDSSQEYRDIYHYVVGDYQCFLVEVHELRSEAEAAKVQDQDTPQDIGKKTAEEFTWNAVW